MIYVLLTSEFPWQRNVAITFSTCLCISRYQDFFFRNHNIPVFNSSWPLNKNSEDLFVQGQLRSLGSHQRSPMWPGFKSRRRLQTWLEFVVGSLLCFNRFFSGFPFSSKTNTSKFQFYLERTDTFKRLYKNSQVLCG